MEKPAIEKFTESDLNNLRADIKQAGLDSWQAAEILSEFLSGRGYGSDTLRLRSVVLRLDSKLVNLQGMQEELEKIAFVM